MNEQAVAEFIRVNQGDLVALGMLFCRLLQADFHVLDTEPSPVLAVVMSLSRNDALGMKKPVEQLIAELDATGMDLLVDGFHGSILRL